MCDDVFANQEAEAHDSQHTRILPEPALKMASHDRASFHTHSSNVAAAGGATEGEHHAKGSDVVVDGVEGVMPPGLGLRPTPSPARPRTARRSTRRTTCTTRPSRCPSAIKHGASDRTGRHAGLDAAEEARMIDSVINHAVDEAEAEIAARTAARDTTAAPRRPRSNARSAATTPASCAGA